MFELPRLENWVREQRSRRGWSQEELARRSGLSRAGISAIETGRLVPSAAAALALATAFDCCVEDLFRLPRPATQSAIWAWPPNHEPCRYWHAFVGERTLLYPVEATPLGVIPQDGIYREGDSREQGRADPSDTLVIACCDPAVGLLAAELARSTGVRLIALPRSSRAALVLLGQGLIHVAGVHLARVGDPGENATVVRDQLGAGYRLLHVARWEEGVTFKPCLHFATIREAVHANLRWIGREPGSGARQCLDELFGGRQLPLCLASDHRSVAEAVRSGWADVGVCLRLVSEEAGLDFLGVREEPYDLCFPDRWKSDHRIRALIDVVRSSSYRRTLGELPGYESSETGELQRVL